MKHIWGTLENKIIIKIDTKIEQKKIDRHQPDSQQTTTTNYNNNKKYLYLKYLIITFYIHVEIRNISLGLNQIKMNQFLNIFFLYKEKKICSLFIFKYKGEYKKKEEKKKV